MNALLFGAGLLVGLFVFLAIVGLWDMGGGDSGAA